MNKLDRLKKRHENLKEESSILKGKLESVEQQIEQLDIPEGVTIETWIERQKDTLEEYQNTLDDILEEIEEILNECKFATD